MKNNQVLIGVVIVVLLLAVGGYFVLFANKSTPQKEASKPVSQDEVVPTISADQLGLTLTARSDNKAIKFAISNPKDIILIDYELSYLAKGDIPRGAIGHVDVKPEDRSVESKFIDLGTCSSGKCKYDEGVKSVKIVLKITKTDGKVYQAEKSLDLSQ